MATSGSSDYSLTVNQVCQAALELIGATAIGDAAGATDMAKAREQLNLMVKTWGASADPKLWLLTEASQALTAATASYNLAAARKVLSVRRRAAGIDIPLTEMSRDEYFEFPSKAAPGTPYAWYFDPQRATRLLYVLGVPDATVAASTTLQYSYLRVIEDLDSFANDIDVPQEWLEALEYSLAARLSVPYRLHVTDQVGAALIQQRAADLYAQLSSYDEEAASVFLQPA